MKKITRIIGNVSLLMIILAVVSRGEVLPDFTDSIFLFVPAPRIAQEANFCGTEHDPVKIAAHEREFTARKRTAPPSKKQNEAETVNVYFHVVTNRSFGDVSDAAIQAQIEVLNAAFSGQGVNFNLAGINRISHGGWYNACEQPAVESLMKSALRVGSADDLNVYTCNPRTLLGFARYPWYYAADPALDGVVIHFGTLPGGYLPDSNTGEALVHETGHWMGLYHTFQGDNGFDGTCGGNGDYVADTPDEFSASVFACPIGLDTCPQPGLDPTDNYMDYSGDACWTRFTTGQKERMAEQFALYRAGQ